MVQGACATAKGQTAVSLTVTPPPPLFFAPALKATLVDAQLGLDFSSEKEPSDMLHKTQFIIRWTLDKARRYGADKKAPVHNYPPLVPHRDP